MTDLSQRADDTPDDVICERAEEPLFERSPADGVEVLIPGERASGPWFPGVQHGGAVAGIVMRAIEALPSPVPMAVTRLTLDLSRKVPLLATTVSARIVRDGRRVQAVEAVVVVDGVEVSRATALRIRTAPNVIDADISVPSWPEDASPKPPGSCRAFSLGHSFSYLNCFDTRAVDDGVPGRGTTWFRPRNPLVTGEVPSPAVRAAMIADMTMSAATVVGFDRYLSANPDLTITLSRPAEGPWIALGSQVRFDRSGIGHSDGVLSDGRGRFGLAVKSLLIDPR